MRNFQDTFETRKRSFISASSICMTVPLMVNYAINGKYISLTENHIGNSTLLSFTVFNAIRKSFFLLITSLTLYIYH